MATVHDRIRELRMRDNLTQSDLADKLGVAPQTISLYEKGREPNYDILIKIRDIFNVSFDFLLGTSDFMRPEHEIQFKESELYHKIKRPDAEGYSLFSLEDGKTETDILIDNAINTTKKFYKIIDYCSEHHEQNAVKELDNLLSEILKFMNSEMDLEIQKCRDIIKLCRESESISSDSLNLLNFKHKNIDSSINALNSFIRELL